MLPAKKRSLPCAPLKLSVFILAVVLYFLLYFQLTSKQHLASPSSQIFKHFVIPVKKYDGSLKAVVNSTYRYTEKKLLSQLWTTNNETSLPKKSSLDFDEFVDDRILPQWKWMINISKSDYFKNLKPKRILLNGDFWYLYDQEGLQCPPEVRGWKSKCLVTENKDSSIIFSESEMRTFDAVIQMRIGDSDFESVYEKTGENLPTIVNLMHESPFFNGNVDLSVNKSLLASYWRGSDITVPYYKWIPFQNHTGIPKPTSKNYALGKISLVAIVVSDCDPLHARLEYVKLLQQHVTVDVYGKCGETCTEPCFKTLGKKYKFYLAFENANCRDYITEKFFRNALLNNMVPVVLGAHRKDYLYAAPPNSFIHVEDFKSPAELAAYLVKLDNNDELYNAYFSWIDTGEVYKSFNEAICRICAALFMAEREETAVWPPHVTFANVNKCLPPKRWYWDRQSNF